MTTAFIYYNHKHNRNCSPTYNLNKGTIIKTVIAIAAIMVNKINNNTARKPVDTSYKFLKDRPPPIFLATLHKLRRKSGSVNI